MARFEVEADAWADGQKEAFKEREARRRSAAFSFMAARIYPDSRWISMALRSRTMLAVEAYR